MLDDVRQRRRQGELRRARDARHRARIREGKARYSVEIDGAALDLLVTTGARARSAPQSPRCSPPRRGFERR
jgi:hypothetical protein